MIQRFAVTVLLIALASELSAQQLDPRAYSVSPTGVNIVIASYGYSSGDVTFDPALPIDDGHAQIHSAAAGYFRSINVAGRSANVTLVAPYIWGNLQGNYLGSPAEAYRSGVASPLARFAINLYGARAMKLKEFAAYRQKTIIGASVVVSPPAGQYDPAKAINVGSNRWAFKPEVGVSHAFRKTRLVLDAYAGVWIYTDNHNFQGSTRSQKPIYSVQFHVSYDIKPRLWLAFDANFYRGGQTTLHDLERNDVQRNSRLGGTISVPLGRRSSVKASYSAGALRTIGGNFNTASVAYQYLWGGGL